MPWEGSATSCGKLLLTLPAALHLDLDRHRDEDGAGGDNGGDDVEEEEVEDDGTHFLSSLHLNIEPDHVPVCMRMTVMILMIVLRFRMRMMR